MGKLKEASLKAIPQRSTRDYAKDEARWKAESDLDALMRAIEIRKDKARFSNAMAIAKERKAKLSAIADEDGDED